MAQKFQRPSGAYGGQSGLSNRSKYTEDANASPKRPISSSKIDGDFNYLIDAMNQIDDASGSRASVAERLDVSLNADGTLKLSVAGTLDEWVMLPDPGSINRVDNSTIALGGGDFTALFQPNRRARVMVGGMALVGDVVSSSFAGGVTTVSMVDLVDTTGALGVISVAPTQVAYGPLTSGITGNTPRRVNGLTLTAAANSFAFGNEAGDLAIRRNGTLVSRVGAGGISGLDNASVTLASLASAVANALTPTGSLTPYAGSTAPTGWIFCHGQAVSRSTFAALFAVIGTTYGAGDGSTTFGIPDLRGRTIFGRDDMGGTVTNRITTAGSSINGVQLGAAGGSQFMHGHTHTVTDPGHSHALSQTTHGFANAPANNGKIAAQNSGVSDGGNLTVASATTGITLATTGTGTSQNMPPAIILNWMMKA